MRINRFKIIEIEQYFMMYIRVSMPNMVVINRVKRVQGALDMILVYNSYVSV